jgi:hypothetical protein
VGFFGGDDKEAKGAALAAEVSRLDRLPLAAVAEEIAAKGFGPGGPGAETATSVPRLVDALNPSGRSLSTDPATLAALEQIVAEGVQALEQAGLVLWDFYTHAKPDLRLTRAGRVALAGDGVGAAVAGASA